MAENRRHLQPSKSRVFGDGPDLVPSFELYISGKNISSITPLGANILEVLTSVDYEDDIELSSQITLHFEAKPISNQGQPIDIKQVLESKALQEGNYIDLHIGYGNQKEFVDRCEILKWLPDYDENGIHLTVKAQDGRHRLQASHRAKFKNVGRKKRKTSYTNMSDEQIIEKIAKKYGYKVDADKTEVRKKQTVLVDTPKIGTKGSVTKKKQTVLPSRVQKADQTDWNFVRKLAKINDFDIWVDFQQSKDPANPIEGGSYVIHFKKKKEIGVEPAYRFSYGPFNNGEIISAKPDFSIKDKPTGVEVVHYDTATKKIQTTVIDVDATAESMKLNGAVVGPNGLRAREEILSGARVRFTAFGQTIEAFSDRPFSSKNDALDFINRWLIINERNLIQMELVVVGVPSLRSRDIFEVEGLSSRLDGYYRATNVKHTFTPDGIYTTTIKGYKILSAQLYARPKTKVKSLGEILITKYNRVPRFKSRDPLGEHGKLPRKK